jgi:UDP-N-acetyl-2-amino-2-deoxyglucuronate dehydrogenase
VTVRLGFLGAGFIADYHASMLQLAGADAVITVVFDPAPGRADAFSARWGGTAVAGEDEVLDGCDAVYVCTWTSEHPRLVAAAAARGVAVFCEKPLATDLASARVLAASAAGVVNQVGLVLRDSPAFLLLRDMVADPADGEVLTVVFRDDQYLPTRGQYRSQWRGDPARAGAGTLLEHSIHDLDLLEWLFGTAVAISARTAHHHGIDGIEDVASVNVAFASGASAHLTSVWHDVLGRPSQRRMEVFRRRGWYCLEGDVFGPVRWTRSTPDEVAAADAHTEGSDATDGSDTPGWQRGVVTEPDSLEGDELVAELVRRGIALRFADAGFVDAVAAGRPATPDLAVAVRAHVLADAAYRSAADGGTWLDIEPPATP